MRDDILGGRGLIFTPALSNGLQEAGFLLKKQ